MWNPTVMISGEKGFVAKALKLDAYIDDRWDNCVDVVNATRIEHKHVELDICDTQVSYTYDYPCRVFLLSQPWNAGKSMAGVERIDAVADMLDGLGLERQKAA
jgi:hypothetical protein